MPINLFSIPFRDNLFFSNGEDFHINIQNTCSLIAEQSIPKSKLHANLGGMLNVPKQFEKRKKKPFNLAQISQFIEY